MVKGSLIVILICGTGVKVGYSDLAVVCGSAVVSLLTTDVSTRRLSPSLTLPGIRSLHRFGKSG